jgi:hypothetical protein
LLFEVLLEGIGQVVVEGLVRLGWESLRDSVRPARESRPLLAGIGHFLLGTLAGGVSLGIIPHRLVPQSPLPGLSLLLSPLGNGLVMHAVGRWWDDRPSDRPSVFTFSAGAIFAFGMALVRFVWLN